MTSLVASAEIDPFVIPGIFAVAIGTFVFFRVRELIAPRLLVNRLRRFSGKGYRDLKAHEKSFPGYDLASIHVAVKDFLTTQCESFVTIGSAQPTHSIGELLLNEGQINKVRRKAQRLNFERIATDVDKEESFATNILYFATARDPAINSGKNKYAVLIDVAQARRTHFREVDERSAPPSQVSISIACASPDFANQFFKEIEERRKALIVYRGKVIDPVIDGGGVQTIAFRNITRVSADDLVLPTSVRELIHGSIVNFYTHTKTLRAAGVELKRGILFHSQPGTGKTSISLYLAGLLPKFTICFVSGQKLLFPRELCSMARYLQPSMLVFEDIDLIAQERGSNGLATVLGELMNQIDGCEPNDQVLFVMNTNSMDRLEEAVRNRPGRVDQIIRIPLPDRAERGLLIAHFARSVMVSQSAIDSLAQASDGVTPAVLKEVVKRAVVMAVAEIGSVAADSAENSGRKPTQVKVREPDLLLALEQVLALRTKYTAAEAVDRPAIGF